MKNSFLVKITDFSNLTELPGSWTGADFSSLLDVLDYGDRTDLSKEDLKEVCLMSLQDLSPIKAAEHLLNFKMKTVLNPGQIKNASGNMLDEKLWEEYANPALHESFFNVGSLLYKAFPSICPKPDAVKMSLEISGLNDRSEGILKKAVGEPLVIRILADGMDEGTSLRRMYGEQIEGATFKEAEHIIWTLDAGSSDTEKKNFSVTSSGFWLDPLEHIEEFESSGHPDDH